MGCGGSKPEPVPEPEPVHDPYSLDAVKSKLAENADAPGFKKEKTFKRKFEGFKVGGGSKHHINRHVTAEDRATAAYVNDKLRDEAAASSVAHRIFAMPRAMTRSFTRRASPESSEGSSSSFVRSMSRMFTRGKKSRSNASLGSDSSMSDADFAKEHDRQIQELNAKWADSNEATEGAPAAARPAAAKASKSKVKFGAETSDVVA